MTLLFTPDNLKSLATLLGIIAPVVQYIIGNFKKLKHSKLQSSYEKTVSYLEKYNKNIRDTVDPLELERATQLYVGSSQISVREFDLFKHSCDLKKDYRDFDYMIYLYRQSKDHLVIDETRELMDQISFSAEMETLKKRNVRRCLYLLYYFLIVFAGISIAGEVALLAGNLFDSGPSLMRSVVQSAAYILIMSITMIFALQVLDNGSRINSAANLIKHWHKKLGSQDDHKKKIVLSESELFVIEEAGQPRDLERDIAQ